MSRLTNDDRHWGPITYAKSSWSPLRLVFSTGGGDDGDKFNSITGYAFGWVARLRMPTLVKPWRRKVIAGWDAATVARLGRNWYWDEEAREYGFSLHEGFLQVFYGIQPGDSSRDQNWCKHLPWTQWRFVRRSLYDLHGDHFWTEPTGRQVPHGGAWEEQQRQRDAVPKARFLIEDCDGKRITATTFIEEREWRFGEGWFKWLSLFRTPKVRRSLDIEFSEEVGPEKGSWKGGLIGTDIDMLPGELHEAAFRRYCEEEHRSKYQRYRIAFVGAELRRRDLRSEARSMSAPTVAQGGEG